MKYLHKSFHFIYKEFFLTKMMIYYYYHSSNFATKENEF